MEDGVLDLNSLWGALPVLLSFFVIVVPFYHGMNRHLDRCYIEKKDSKVYGALLIDFIIFCLESSLLFIFAKSITFGIKGFVLLWLILIVDLLWGLISHYIHYRHYTPSTIRWAIINFVTIVIGFIIFSLEVFEFKAWIFFFILLSRTVADYSLCWKFYFPDQVAGTTE